MVNNRLDLTKEPIQVKSHLNHDFSTVSPKATKSVSLKCVAESRVSILGHCICQNYSGFGRFIGIIIINACLFCVQCYQLATAPVVWQL